MGFSLNSTKEYYLLSGVIGAFRVQSYFNLEQLLNLHWNYAALRLLLLGKGNGFSMDSVNQKDVFHFFHFHLFLRD